MEKREVFEMTQKINIYKKWFLAYTFTNTSIGEDKELSDC